MCVSRMEAHTMARTATRPTVTANCRRCHVFDELDSRQTLCDACRWDLGLTGMESYRVAVEPITVPHHCEACGLEAATLFPTPVISCGGDGTVSVCWHCAGWASEQEARDMNEGGN